MSVTPLIPDLAPPLQPFLDAITPVICDTSNWVTPSLARFVSQGLQRYSKDRPLEIVSDVIGDGSAYVPLPVVYSYAPSLSGAVIVCVAPPVVLGAPAPPAPGWVPVFDPTFSSLLRIEYPIGEIPEVDVEIGDWQLYRQPSGYQLQLKSYNPNAGESVRLTWTAMHAPDGSTVPTNDFYAVADISASMALEAMAAYASNLGDSTMGADSNNYRSRASEYIANARIKRKSYFNHLGIDESDTATEQRPAMAIGRMDNILSSAGVDRLVHGRFTR